MLTAVEALERRISRKRSRVELKTIRTRYPMGAEKQIVQSVTRREVPPGRPGGGRTLCGFQRLGSLCGGRGTEQRPPRPTGP